MNGNEIITNIKIDKKPTISPIKRDIHTRVLALLIVFALFGLTTIGRILYIQYSPMGVDLREAAEGKLNFDTRRLVAKRGDIKTHDGKILATTVPLYHLYMDFRAGGLDSTRFYSNLNGLSSSLSALYKDKSPKEYKDILKNSYKAGYRYKRISPRRVNYIELKKVLNFPLLRDGRHKGGWTLDTVENRVKPYGDLALRTIGSINSNGRGFGVEGSLDSILAGVDGRTKIQKVSGSFWIPMDSHENIKPIDGKDVITTIDAEVQHVAEEMLRHQLESIEANWGSAILMEVETGEVRALANLGRKKDGSYGDIYNYGLGQNMEPGSTFKLISLMSLLDDAGYNINTMVDCGDGRERVGYAEVVDTKRAGHGKIPLGRVFEVSSNIGFARMIHGYYKEKPEQFTNYIRNQKFLEPFNFELDGEAVPSIAEPSKKSWNGRSLTMLAFGYEALMSPLHTLSIYNSVANNGVLVKPRIIKGYVANDNNIEFTKIDTLNSKVCSDRALRELKYTLEQVVNDGTAKVLRNPYYKVAGKTGTAQVSKNNLGYHYNGGRNYLATVVGYFPADKPKYSCIVAVEVFHKDGTTTPYYGGTVSGPIFRAVADKVYSQAVDWGNELERPMIKSTTTTITRTKNSNDKHVVIKSGNRDRVEHIYEQLSIPNISSGNVVYIDSDGYIEDVAALKYDTTAPDVTGMGLRDAMVAINKAGYRATIKGSGVVVKQKLVELDSTQNRVISLTLE